MKKVILSVALMLGIIGATQAQSQNKGQIRQEQTTVITHQSQDNGFKDVKLEELNEKVQAAIRALAESYEIDSLQFNEAKQITKVEATKKDDQSKKTFYFDVEGNEITMDITSEQAEKTDESKEVK
jgi:KaiC/GvpD/RAD55 family RecA-like ATPase